MVAEGVCMFHMFFLNITIVGIVGDNATPGRIFASFQNVGPFEAMLHLEAMPKNKCVSHVGRPEAMMLHPDAMLNKSVFSGQLPKVKDVKYFTEAFMVACIFNGVMGTLTFVSTPESSRRYVENAALNGQGGIRGFSCCIRRYFFLEQKICSVVTKDLSFIVLVSVS